MSSDPRLSTPLPRLAPPSSNRRIWWAYGGGCLLAWLLYVLAGAEFQRGLWQLWEAVYQASLSLWAPMLLGAAIFPWVRGLQALEIAPAGLVALHLGAAFLFGALWQLCEFALAWALFGLDHATAVLVQTLLWRAIWGLVVYAAIATAFTALLQTQRARAAALAAAQAESALARAELAAISGKLNPHFLFNTLNSLIALTRKDAQAAEAALLRFSGMLRYVLDTKRSAADRVSLAEEVEFVRDYLALEALRLGPRLQIDWQLDPDTLQDEVPPLTLQPLVENSIQHGVAPRLTGGSIRIRSGRNVMNQGLELSVEDDGPGCDPARLDEADAPQAASSPAAQGRRRGIGLSALKRRFAIDYEGQARLRVQTAPGAGFRVDLWIPQ
ncbi:sensor histidine kinase [Roseateles violae]|uniref:Histidine kinase n=1 Tax=Roseateles violae TaxID=3058042 RepID=A0ABT8DKA8_9BURK|nr:histidine kinase [Pelomonas sp. PFR6]MDN3918850.1 histidine kinase [Pelomonas sp. PFR6]